MNPLGHLRNCQFLLTAFANLGTCISYLLTSSVVPVCFDKSNFFKRKQVLIESLKIENSFDAIGIYGEQLGLLFCDLHQFVWYVRLIPTVLEPLFYLFLLLIWVI